MSIRELQTPALDSGARLIDGSMRDFREHFNRSSFSFSHHLCDNPLFELPRLLQLAKRGSELKLHYDAGDVRVDQRWDQIPKKRVSVEELTDQIGSADTWMHFKPARLDPEYAAVVDRFLDEVDDLTGGGLPERMMKREAIVLITSPNRITPYHIDFECNFLLQLRGEKVIYIHDRFDREVLPEEEIERFWAVDSNAAVYKERYLDRARAYHLKPGSAVHIPVNAPHWVKNSDDVSVSLSLSFQFLESELANIYRANYYLRKLGLMPRPPGRSKFRDAAKASAMGGALRAGRALKRLIRRGG